MKPVVSKKTIYILFLSLLVILAVSGVLLLHQLNNSIGGALVAIAIGLFIFSTYVIEKQRLTEEGVVQPTPRFVRLILIFLSLTLAGLLILNLIDLNRTPELDKSATLEWVLSILCFSSGVLWHQERKPIWPGIIERLKNNKTEVILLGTLFVASLFLRLIFLLQHPYPWAGDEAEVGLEGMRLLNGQKTNLFEVGWSAQPMVSFVPTMVSMWVFGQTMFAVKLVSVLVGALSTLAIYFLAREWFGFEIAIISSAFLVAYPVHLQFSRIGVGNIYDSLMAPLVLWLVFRASRTGNVILFLLAGLFCGFTFYLYAGTKLVLALAIGAFIYIGMTQKSFFQSSKRQLWVYLGGVLVTINPIAVFFIQYPVYFMMRFGQEGIFLNGWLERHIAETGLTVWEILLDQFLRTVKVFFISNASLNFLNFDRPYLTILGAVFFVLGFIYSLLKLFDQRYFVLQMWFWSVVILGGVLTFFPPANTRLVMISPTMGIFIALGAWQVSMILLAQNVKRSWVNILNVVLVLVLTFQNISFYFIHYYVYRLSNHPGGEVAMEAGLQLQRLGEEYDYFLLGDPVVLADMPTTVFLAPHNKKVNLTADTLSNFVIESGHGAFIVAIPENKDILDKMMKQYPGGELKFTRYKLMNKILYYSYLLPPNTGTEP